jgi:transcriptional regulator with XRE-family HTH domain
MNELRRLREAAELSQAELANKVDSQQPQIARWEKDTRQMPFEWAIKFSIFFHCHPSVFRPELGGDGLDALLYDHPEIKQRVREFAEFLLRKSDS